MKSFFSALLIALAAGAPLTAHPHMLIVTSLEPKFDGKECSGVWVDWGFDTAFGASILNDFDKNKDGVFNKAETKEVHDTAFINLKKYGYFIILRKGDVRTKASQAENFSVFLKGKQLHYKFFLPLKDRGYSEDFSVSVFDPTYFCETRYEEPPVKFAAAPGKGPSPVYEILENKKYPVYYDPYGAAADTTTYQKWKPGLQTAYPKEIRLYFRN